MSRGEYVPPDGPAPRAIASCPGCRAFVPECLVPCEVLYPTATSGPPVRLCWLCAHVIADHGATLDTAVEAIGSCSCALEDVYPAAEISRRRVLGIAGWTQAEEVLSAELVRRVTPAAPAARPPEPEVPRSKAMSGRARTEAARRAAALTADARRENELARRRAGIDADRLEAPGLPEPERDRVDRVVRVRN